MNITVIGTGFVGVVTSGVLAQLGHHVWGLDVDEQKIRSLQLGTVPFFEPGLTELIQEGMSRRLLGFTTDYAVAIADADVIIIAVGTPSASDGTADLTYVYAAAKAAAPYLKNNAIVAIKSTVPPGTNDKVRRLIEPNTAKQFFVVSLPEFLKEGSAVYDTLHPDRVIIGATEPKVIKTLLAIHEPLGGDRVVITPESAQMAKYTANAYLAQRITFINQIANLCEKNGAQINEVIEAIGRDRRIGRHYWYPGLGYGGSCFPKDVKELAAYAHSIGEGKGLLPKIDELNEHRIPEKMRDFEQTVGGFNGKRIAVLGLAFKPNTNDTRYAPSLQVIPYLTDRKAEVSVYDPQVKTEALRFFRGVTLADDAYRAIAGADVIFILVEWDEFKHLDLGRIKSITPNPCWLIDTRNLYPPETVRAAGLAYIGIGTHNL